MIRAETTLDNIFRKEHLLFLDTSAGKGLGSEGMKNWYAEGIYDAKSFEQVDSASLIYGLEELEILKQISLEDRTLVTPEVLQEISRLSEIMQRHFEYATRQKQTRIKRASHYEPGELQRERQIYDMFNACVLNLVSIRKRLERKVFQPRQEEQAYLKFLNAAKTAAAIPGVKRDLSQRYQDSYKTRTGQTETDEIVVGNALYTLSLPEHQVVGIITGDSHIERIRNATFGIIKRDSEFKDLIETLKGKRLPVYFSLGKERYAVS